MIYLIIKVVYLYLFQLYAKKESKKTCIGFFERTFANTHGKIYQLVRFGCGVIFILESLPLL